MQKEQEDALRWCNRDKMTFEISIHASVKWQRFEEKREILFLNIIITHELNVAAWEQELEVIKFLWKCQKNE